MKVLVVGPRWIGSNALSMANAFAIAGFDTVMVDSTASSWPKRFSPGWWRRRFTGRNASGRFHDDLEHLARDWRPDVLFCFKTIYLDQGRLTGLDVPLKIHYSPDDASNPANLSAGYLSNEREWDVVVTTKSHNVVELRARGARDVCFVLSAYDPAWHHPVARRSSRRYRVGFIGSDRPDRAGILTRLGERYGTDLLVAGNMSRNVAVRRSGAALAGPVYAEDFSRAVGEIQSNLVLLNSDNRDTHTCRSFEVPAAGGLFVGERTGEHSALITDGVDGLLFDDEAEMLEKLRWVDRHDVAAEQMRRRGWESITRGGHRYVDRVHEIARHVGIAP